jgi:hypothetical protein
VCEFDRGAGGDDLAPAPGFVGLLLEVGDIERSNHPRRRERAKDEHVTQRSDHRTDVLTGG